ncbi:hypothetical protein VTI74DRAFT_718 [Chaetomium olivicolor]
MHRNNPGDVPASAVTTSPDNPSEREPCFKLNPSPPPTTKKKKVKKKYPPNPEHKRKRTQETITSPPSHFSFLRPYPPLPSKPSTLPSFPSPPCKEITAPPSSFIN